MYRRYRERRHRRREYYNDPGRRFTSALRRPSVQIGILVIVGFIIYLILLLGGSRGNAAAGQISTSEAFSRYQNGAFVLDVRTVEEWNQFHVPHTTLIPLDQLAGRLNELPRDREIVVVCRSGNRSQQARDILINAGFTRVTSMQGGLEEWRASGYPIEP